MKKEKEDKDSVVEMRGESWGLNSYISLYFLRLLSAKLGLRCW